MIVSGKPELDKVRGIVQAVVDDIPLSTISSNTRTKDDGSCVTEIDLLIQQRLIDELQREWPQYALIGEEMEYSDQVSLLEEKTQGIWCLDPLDGTTNFASGFPFYGVSLAFIERGRALLGVVYDPVRRECFYAELGQGAFCNGEPLTPTRKTLLRNCLANVDYKRLVGRLTERLIHSPPFRSQRNLGSSVLEWCWLAAGRIDIYIHGGQKLWDYAAGSLVLSEAGGCASSIEGKAITCERMCKQSVVAAANRDLLQEWRNWVAQNINYKRRN